MHLRSLRFLAYGCLFTVGAYLCHVSVVWYRYGRAGTCRQFNGDEFLDRLLPGYDVVERVQTRVAAPADLVFRNACDLRLQAPFLVRAIFKTREFILGGTQEQPPRDLGLLQQAKTWGWSLLAERAGQEVVFGAITQPWIAHPIFHGPSPEEFTEFAEPGWVKIAWTLRVDPAANGTCVAITETRALATGKTARSRFRLYWAFVSPGTLLIRWIALRQVKKSSEREASSSDPRARLNPASSRTDTHSKVLRPS